MTAPRVGDTITVTGVVRTVEALHPAGHLRVTVDVPAVAEAERAEALERVRKALPGL